MGFPRGNLVNSEPLTRVLQVTRLHLLHVADVVHLVSVWVVDVDGDDLPVGLTLVHHGQNPQHLHLDHLAPLAPLDPNNNSSSNPANNNSSSNNNNASSNNNYNRRSNNNNNSSPNNNNNCSPNNYNNCSPNNYNNC